MSPLSSGSESETIEAKKEIRRKVSEEKRGAIWEET